MSIEYIEQLITNLRSYQSDVEERKTEADQLRQQLETTQAQLKVALDSLKDSQKTQAQLTLDLTKRDQELTKIAALNLEVQAKMNQDRQRADQVKTQRDTLQKQVDILTGMLNATAKDYYNSQMAKANTKAT